MAGLSDVESGFSSPKVTLRVMLSPARSRVRSVVSPAEKRFTAVRRSSQPLISASPSRVMISPGWMPAASALLCASTE